MSWQSTARLAPRASPPVVSRSNFEIGRLAFFRSPAYRSFFAHLEAAGGFFYERCALLAQLRFFGF